MLTLKEMPTDEQIQMLEGSESPMTSRSEAEEAKLPMTGQRPDENPKDSKTPQRGALPKGVILVFTFYTWWLNVCLMCASWTHSLSNFSAEKHIWIENCWWHADGTNSNSGRH